MKAITVYKEINQLHEISGGSLRTKNSLFHCFDIADVNEKMITSLPPFRSDFFTLSLSYGSNKFKLKLNDRTFDSVNHFLVCVAPGQVSQFEKNGDWFGFCTFFKSEFLQYKNELNFLEDYPFFNVQETNLLPINDEQFNRLSLNYRQILEEQLSEAAYSTEIIRSSFEAILWQVRRIYDGIRVKMKVNAASAVIASQFLFLVNRNFMSKIYVEDYAELLNITPNHLSQMIKQATGKTAKSIISQRRLDEAKFLLRYTTNEISEIAYHLNFAEPTHFVKFFKKNGNNTPGEYRSLQTAHKSRYVSELGIKAPL